MSNVRRQNNMDVSTVSSLVLAILIGAGLIIAVKADNKTQDEAVAKAYRMGRRAGRREGRKELYK